MRRVCQCNQGRLCTDTQGYVVFRHGGEEENDVYEGQHLSWNETNISNLEADNVDVVRFSRLGGMTLSDLRFNR